MFQNRLWRKTRKPYGLCYGSDPNRNWGYKWMCKFLIWYINLSLNLSQDLHSLLESHVPFKCIKITWKIFSFNLLAGGASNNPCSETYGGSSAFSDVETKSLSEYFTAIASKFTAYVSFHSYSQLLMFPYGHTTQHLDNYNDEVSENSNYPIKISLKDFIIL